MEFHFDWSALPLSYEGAGALDGDRTRDPDMRVGLIRLGAKKRAAATSAYQADALPDELFQQACGLCSAGHKKMSRARVSKPRGMFPS